MRLFNKSKFACSFAGFLAAIMFLLIQPVGVFAQEEESVDQVEQVDSTATQEVGDQEEVEAESAETDAEAAAVADATGGDDDSAAVEEAASTSASSSTARASKVEEKSNIPPQVYMNLFYYIILFLIVCAVVAIVNRVLSIYELTLKMNGRFNSLAGNNLQAVLFVIFLLVFLWGTYYSFAVWGDWAYRPAATEHGKKWDIMFIITTAICVVVLVVMHLLIFSFTYIYRMRHNRKAYYYPHNNTLEKIWTVVPATVLTILVLYGFFTWREIMNVPEDLKKSAVQIEVLGEQFAWQVRYPGSDGIIGKRDYKMTTANNPYGIDFNDKNSWDDIRGSDIVIPVNRSVRFHIISKDILHSFFIPDFRVQINAVPGMTNYFQFTPTVTTEEMREKMDDPEYDFIMLCAKICGSGHYNMQKKIKVVSDQEYEEWLSQQGKYFSEDLQKEFLAKDSDQSDSDNNLAAITE